MELLLNILWLLLAVPAFWMWQHPRGNGEGTHACGPLRALALLGCVLLLLFPVVSATDDIHAIRPEIEESQSKRIACANCAARIGRPAKMASQPVLYAGLL